MTARSETGAIGLLASPVRRRLVDTVVARSPGGAGEQGLTATQLTEIVGLHVSTVRFHLDQLVAAGILASAFVRPGGVGRPRKVYAPAPGSLEGTGRVEETESLRLLSGLLAQGLAGEPGSPRPTPADVGRAWVREHVSADPAAAPADTPGRWLAKVGQMIDVLEGWGYTPNLATTDEGRTATVALTRCPFIELARDNPAVVCGIHRGLIAGALEQFGEHDTEVGLQPFVEPTLCLAHIRTTAPFRRPPSKEHP